MVSKLGDPSIQRAQDKSEGWMINGRGKKTKVLVNRSYLTVAELSEIERGNGGNDNI